MTRWLARAAGAARIAADRPDLWLAGSLAWMAYLGWLPLLLVIGVVPTLDELSFAAADLYGSSSYPWNLLLLSLGAGILAISACLFGALGQVAILRGLRPRTDGAAQPSLSHEVGICFSLTIASSVPLVVGLVGLVIGIAAIAPGEFMSPDTSGELGWRLFVRLAPLGALALAGLLVAQSLGAATLRRAVGPGATDIGAAFAGGARGLLRRPVSRLAVALGCLLVDLLVALLAFALLRVLWAPIALNVVAGGLLAPEALVLLLAFVAIWLVLALAGGIEQLLVAAWWSAELDDGYHRAILEPV